MTVDLMLKWLYTGNIDVPKGSVRELTLLYILADQLDLLPLRRTALNRIVRELCRHNHDVPCYHIIRLVCEHLPVSSPLHLWYLLHYVHHWNAFWESAQSRQYFLGLPAEFLSKVMRAQARLGLHSLYEKPCCHDVCFFHEHSSAEERLASKHGLC